MGFFEQWSTDVLDMEVLGATVFDWVRILIAWLVISAVFLLIRRLVFNRVIRLAERTTNRYDDYLAVLLKRTKAFFLIVVALFLASLAITATVPRSYIGTFTILVTLFQVVIWGNAIIARGTTRFKEEKLEQDAAAVTTVMAMGFLGRVMLYALVLLMALDNLGFDVTALIAGLGVGGIAVALAVQNILGDLIASLSIVLDKPFVVGDFLILGDYLGTVEHIGLKTTRLRSLSGEQLVFSNSDLLNSRIRNYKRMFERRIVFGFGVVYQTPADRLEAIPGMVREIIEARDPVRFDRAHFKAFGGSSLDFEAVYYVLVPDYNVYMDVQQAINLALFRRFEDLRIEFAYPTQTLHVESVPASMTPRTAGVVTSMPDSPSTGTQSEPPAAPSGRPPSDR